MLLTAVCVFCNAAVEMESFSRVRLLKVTLDNLKGHLDGELCSCWSHSQLVLNVSFDIKTILFLEYVTV